MISRSTRNKLRDYKSYVKKIKEDIEMCWNDIVRIQLQNTFVSVFILTCTSIHKLNKNVWVALGLSITTIVKQAVARYIKMKIYPRMINCFVQ